MTKFLLIRHAVTDAVGKKLSGRKPGVLLNADGSEQAQNLAMRLSGLPIAAVYSSPLERAQETAAPLAKALQLPVVASNDFMEIDFGEWTDNSFDALNQQPLFRQFNTFRSSTRIPGGETMLEAQVRIVNGMQQLCTRHLGETVAVVSHSDLIKAAVAYYAGIHLDLFQRLEISPASVSIIEIYAETARVLLVNDTGGIKI